MDAEQAERIAKQISEGHAFAFHVQEAGEFPEIKTRDDFAELITDVLTSPASLTRNLLRGRVGFWSDVHRTVVIVD
jgi:hypothetical protein